MARIIPQTAETAAEAEAFLTMGRRPVALPGVAPVKPDTGQVAIGIE
jgi:hypothetical protein